MSVASRLVVATLVALAGGCDRSADSPPANVEVSTATVRDAAPTSIAPPSSTPKPASDIDALREQMAAMQKKLDELGK